MTCRSRGTAAAPAGCVSADLPLSGSSAFAMALTPVFFIIRFTFLSHF